MGCLHTHHHLQGIKNKSKHKGQITNSYVEENEISELVFTFNFTVIYRGWHDKTDE